MWNDRKVLLGRLAYRFDEGNIYTKLKASDIFVYRFIIFFRKKTKIWLLIRGKNITLLE